MKSVHVFLTVAGLISSSVGLADDALEAGFAVAQPEFSPVPIWWWSGDRVERDRLREQLERMAEGGIHNAIVLNLAPSGPLYGSAADEPPFLSEEWWDLFAYAVTEGKRVGVKLWFYDQLGFSGAGLQARVVRDHPEFRGVTLQRMVSDVDGPGETELAAPPDGTPLAGFVARLVEKKEEAVAQWLWDRRAGEGVVTRCFRRRFRLDAASGPSHINITCDNGYKLYLNGVELGSESRYGEDGWKTAERYDATPLLRAGENVIAVEAANLGGPGGLLVELMCEGALPEAVVVSDGTFRMNAEAPENWFAPDFDDGAWPPADVLGALPMEPWDGIAGMETGSASTLGAPIENVQDVTGQVRDGRLRVAVPEGRHRVQLFYTVPGGFDYLNPAAGAALLDVVHGEMERRLGPELGKGIAGSFQDEFPAVPHFSILLPEAFQQRTGYDLLPCLPALYDDVTDRFGAPASAEALRAPDGPSTIQVRCDANRVAAEMAEDAFFKPLYEWHERHGLLAGYDQTVRNADPIRGEGYYVDYFKTMRHYSVPGNDMDGDCKPHESIAALYGRPRVWIEAFHSSGWGQTLEEIAVLLHPWLANGATLFDPHAIYYSIHGSYWEWAPPDTGWRQPYFVHYPVLADYVSRLCYVLSQGGLVVEVGVLHPANTVHAYTGFGAPSSAAQQCQDVYWAVQGALRNARIDYLIVDEDSIAGASIDEGRLRIRALGFHVMVLPSARVLNGRTMQQLADFAAAGGTVIVVGSPPTEAAGPTRIAYRT